MMTQDPTKDPTKDRLCYLADLYPATTSEEYATVVIGSTIEDTLTYHDITFNIIGNDCNDPRLDVIFEEIDSQHSQLEYFRLSNDDKLIATCKGIGGNCGNW